MPNQQRTLNKLPTGLRCRNFVNKHRLSIQVGAKRAETCMQRVHIPTELPLCIPPLVVGYEHGEDLFSCLSRIMIAPPPTCVTFHPPHLFVCRSSSTDSGVLKSSPEVASKASSSASSSKKQGKDSSSSSSVTAPVTFVKNRTRQQQQQQQQQHQNRNNNNNKRQVIWKRYINNDVLLDWNKKIGSKLCSGVPALPVGGAAGRLRRHRHHRRRHRQRQQQRQQQQQQQQYPGRQEDLAQHHLPGLQMLGPGQLLLHMRRMCVCVCACV